jgi:hypothetical protein
LLAKQAPLPAIAAKTDCQAPRAFCNGPVVLAQHLIEGDGRRSFDALDSRKFDPVQAISFIAS